MGSTFAVLNRNKRSLCLDLKAEDDRAIFFKLVEHADVLLENYRPGVVKKLGVDYEALSKLNPGLIYASISGYGQSGPYQNRRVYDPLIQATTGISSAQGSDGPQNMVSIIFDKVTALTTAQVITSALLHRERTGQGQYLPISMLESALYYNWPDVMWSRTLLGEDIQHAGELADYFQIYKVKDGHVAIVLIADEAVELLCIWRESTLHQDPRFQTFAARLAHAADFKDAVDAMLADVTTEEVCSNLDAFNIPVSRVNTLDEVHEDEQVKHAGSLVETTHPVAGLMRFARPPFNFLGQDEFPARHAPRLGEQTRDILSDLGVDDAEIDRLEGRNEANQKMLEAMQAGRA
jgi:crotonobetainyl-CoA:carnitine CoA-transferase CaiB-like acyl-CoA transferase